MRTVEVTVAVEGQEARVVAQAEVARSMWARFWGLMGRRSLAEGEALVIDPCSSVHTMFMRFPIDVVYLNRENRVVKIAHALKPYRASMGKGAHKVLEMQASAAAAAGLAVGDRLDFSEAAE